MTQMDLFDWAKERSTLTDLGGRCHSCLEECNWEIVGEDKWVAKYYYVTETELVCRTPRFDLDDLSFVEICGNAKMVRNEYEP